jgi:hypothetical protein
MNEYDDIRPDIRETLDAWASTGRPVGGFLEAVLTNDLFGAVGRADSYNIETIPAICSYVYNELPSTCWGSREKVAAWSAAHSDLAVLP